MSIYRTDKGFEFVFTLSDNQTRRITSNGIVIPDNLDSEFLTLAAANGVRLYAGTIEQDPVLVGSFQPVDLDLTGLGNLGDGYPRRFFGAWQSRTASEFRNDIGAATKSVANVLDYGAVGNGVTDDTAAINAARSASTNVYLPPGNYVYSGSGIEGAGLNLVGAGAGGGITVVTLAAGASFITGASAVHRMYVTGIRFEGGFGAIRFTNTIASVQNWLVVERCEFYNYTGAAISSLSVDQPYWHIRANVFRAVNDTTATFGIVLAGDNAQSVITSNAFLVNRVHLKLGQNSGGTAGGAVKVRDNDFIRFVAGGTSPRTDLWIVPISGQGDALFLCEGNKFGNENINSMDYRVLYADEDTATGSTAATRLPLLSASTGNIAGHVYLGNGQAGTSGNSPAFITSFTASLRAQSVAHHALSSTLPTSIIDVTVTAPGGMDLGQIGTNIVGPLINHDIGVNYDPSLIVACTKSGYVTVVDPSGAFQAVDQPLLYLGGSSAVGFVNLTGTQQVPTLNIISNVTLSGITDSVGGTNAATVTVTAANGSIYAGLTGMTVGVPVWVEFDARVGGGTPAASAICFVMFNGTRKWTRRFSLSSVWRRYRFLHNSYSTSNQLGFSLHSTATGTFQLGRVRAYHASEPTADLLSDPDPVTTTTAPSAGGGGALPATPIGYLTINVGGTLRQIAYY